ncbi:GNAT family N-acetyltransferase [Kitasatospora aureofaciens]|uniref:GNAT family N-acetyltransferase n=1 Tax=Kitasatospora aureofaciens TaxID=1894 RepID=UPI001C448470|nr:GNAT family N-acetyltransferase [Kitasatospora aureofaciens]MBV6700421.1 GNAT family N-acetyltransferase [Kitasatospora aureofaciens]
MDGIRIRSVHEDDWDAIVALEARAYAAGGLSEGREALRSRHDASPGTCFVLEHRGRFGGYLLALPYPLFRCPDLSRAEAAIAMDADATNMHAHDLVIAEELRGRGLAHRLLRHLEDLARAGGYRTVSLVAVRGSHVVWTPLGYRVRPEIGVPASYGSEAVYMAMPLSPDRTGAPPTHTTDPHLGSPFRAEVG